MWGGESIYCVFACVAVWFQGASIGFKASKSFSRFGLVYWGLTPQQQPGSYQGGEMMMKSVFWWRKPEYPEETSAPTYGK